MAPVPMSASYTSTKAEEVVALLRKLHTLDGWSPVINAYMTSHLSRLPDLMRQDKTTQHLWNSSNDSAGSATASCVMAVLATIGGVDSRPRLGGKVTHEEWGEGTIARIAQNGKITVQCHDDGTTRIARLAELEAVAGPEFAVESSTSSSSVKVCSVSGPCSSG